MATHGAHPQEQDRERSGGGSRPRIPVFDCTVPLRVYRRLVAVWELATDTPLERRGPTLLSELTGKAWEQTETLDIQSLRDPGGVTRLLDFLALRFPEIAVHDTPALLHTFVRPALYRARNEEIMDYNNLFDLIVSKLEDRSMTFPDEVLGDLYVMGALLPEERKAAVLNACGNTYSLRSLQKALMLNLPKVAAVDGQGRQDNGAGGSKFPNKGNGKGSRRTYQTHDDGDDDSEQEENEASDTDSGDYPEELEDIEQEAEDQLTYLTKQIVRAKARLKDAKSARGFYQKANATEPGFRNRAQPRDPRKEDRIRKLKLKSHCSACGERGHWRGDQECRERNNPSAVAPPRDGAKTPTKHGSGGRGQTAHATTGQTGQSQAEVTPHSTNIVAGRDLHTTPVTAAAYFCMMASNENNV